MTKPRRNVFLVVADALRAEHMSHFGYTRATTPHLDRRCADRRHCQSQRLIAACAESYCGLMALARSKPVHGSSSHGLRLSDVLRMHGYRYGLILGGDHTQFHGLADALGPADFFWDGTHARGYGNDDRAVLERVDELPRWDGRATFIQFHLMSTHALGKRHAFAYEPAANYYRRIRIGPSDSELASYRNYYDSGVRQFDTVLAELLARLEAKGYLEDAVVVVTSTTSSK